MDDERERLGGSSAGGPRCRHTRRNNGRPTRTDVTGASGCLYAQGSAEHEHPLGPGWKLRCDAPTGRQRQLHEPRHKIDAAWNEQRSDSGQPLAS